MCAAYSAYTSGSDSTRDEVRHRKMALVIGVNKYGEQSLNNCVNDANDMANALKSIGFQVTKGVDLTHEDMESLIRDFIGQLQPDDIVLFHFSGHGTQWEDQNYLIPSNGERVAISTIKTSAIKAQDVLTKISNSAPYVSVFLLDCCRNYFVENVARGLTKENRGLVAMHATQDQATAGSIIGFACAPGKTAADGMNGAKNGLFTKHLLEYITKPCEQIQDFLIHVSRGVYEESGREQMPHQSTALLDPYICLAKVGDGPIDNQNSSTNDVPVDDVISGSGWDNDNGILEDYPEEIGNELEPVDVIYDDS